MEKFTQGKWVADIRVGCCAVYVKESRDEWEQGLHNDESNIYYKSFPNVVMAPECESESIEPISNAHLIAAAPEMYRMLEGHLAAWDNLYPSEIGDIDDMHRAEFEAVHRFIGKTKQLLAKARGE